MSDVPSRPTRAGPTMLADIIDLPSPAAAPRTIRFSRSNARIFQIQRAASYPGGRAREQGGTFVADADGNLSIQNLGGLASTAGSFTPNLVVREAARYSVVGILHTHPYDSTEGSYTGVSFSGGDIAYLINTAQTMMVVQSGPRLFVLLRTARSPRTVDFNAVNDAQNDAIAARAGRGGTFQQSSRIEAELAAPRYGLAYYQGNDGVVTRVSPR